MSRLWHEVGGPLLTAFRFLTVLPLGGGTEVSPQTLGRSVAWFPAVGLALGTLLALAASGLAAFLPAPVAAGLLLALWVVLTGGLHLDGFLDTCDGLLGGRTPEERLRIMRDERVGAFGVVGGVLLLLTKHAALTAVVSYPTARLAALLLAPTVARGAMAAALVLFPYARAEGLGSALKAHASYRELGTALALTAAVALGVLGPVGLAVAAAGFTVAGAVALWTTRRIPGLTGDVYGALCELVELFLLILLSSPAINGAGFALPVPFGHP